jgi:hypothetical protein
VKIRLLFWFGFAGLLYCGVPATAAAGQSFDDAAKHWSYQPIKAEPPPRVRARTLVQSPVDAFLLAKLEAHNLSFAPAADRRTLVRRLYYDLIGLPPTFEEVQAFERDHSPNAVPQVVDRLLASPRYGERWGRHWLDVARYADTKDLVLVYGKDALRPYAYTYRDYVVRAFNEDLPYNQFVTDQLAADLVQPSLPRWRLAAMGFLTLGRLFDYNPHDQIDDQIDTTTRGFLGLTVACARCHDHKYDAITSRDYYALYGVFASCERPYNLPLLEDPTNVPGGVEFEKQFTRALQELESHIDVEFARLTENFRQRIGDYLVRAATTKPGLWETTQFGLSLIPEDFRPGLVQRTRRLLERRVNPNDRVFGPWSQFAAQCEGAGDEASKENTAPLSTQSLTNVAAYNPVVIEALAKSTITNTASIASTYGQLLRQLYDESKKPAAGSPNGGLNADQRELLALVTSDASPIWFPRRDTPDHMSRAEKDRYGSLVANLDKIAANASNAPPARAMVLADLPEPYQPRIFKRGNPSRPGDTVSRSFLQVLSANHEAKPFTRGSGRLELAQAIACPTNPLTARVLVNRVWMHHFGEPLVASTTDFGVRTEPPLHRELLDWLAADFIKSGWSIKHLHRVILSSAAYQQRSTAPNPLDPENKLLSHYPRRRLDFEATRDSLLSASGQLDLTAGGRPIEISGTSLSSRRTIYGLVDRQNLPAVFRTFDFPVPDQCIERRPQTSVPQQALFNLNSPFVLEQARVLAKAAHALPENNPRERIQFLYRRILERPPTKAEIGMATAFVNDTTSDEGENHWESLAHVLLMSNEFVFLD